MVTTAAPGRPPHEVRPARGNTTCGWLPGGFYAGSPIRCTHWISRAAGEGIRRDESSWALRVPPFPPARQRRAEERERVAPKIPAKPPRGGQVVGLAIAQVSPQCFAKTFPLLSSAHRRAHRLSVLWITG